MPPSGPCRELGADALCLRRLARYCLLRGLCGHWRQPYGSGLAGQQQPTATWIGLNSASNGRLGQAGAGDGTGPNGGALFWERTYRVLRGADVCRLEQQRLRAIRIAELLWLRDDQRWRILHAAVLG